MRIIMLLIVLGLVWWLITFLPLPEPFPTIIHVVVILLLIWELLALAGMTQSVMKWPNPPS